MINADTAIVDSFCLSSSYNFWLMNPHSFFSKEAVSLQKGIICIKSWATERYHWYFKWCSYYHEIGMILILFGVLKRGLNWMEDIIDYLLWIWKVIQQIGDYPLKNHSLLSLVWMAKNNRWVVVWLWCKLTSLPTLSPNHYVLRGVLRYLIICCL